MTRMCVIEVCKISTVERAQCMYACRCVSVCVCTYIYIYLSIYIYIY